jgi:hypothetical protein
MGWAEVRKVRSTTHFLVNNQRKSEYRFDLVWCKEHWSIQINRYFWENDLIFFIKMMIPASFNHREIWSNFSVRFWHISGGDIKLFSLFIEKRLVSERLINAVTRMNTFPCVLCIKVYNKFVKQQNDSKKSSKSVFQTDSALVAQYLQHISLSFFGLVDPTSNTHILPSPSEAGEWKAQTLSELRETQEAPLRIANR